VKANAMDHATGKSKDLFMLNVASCLMLP
jgi:hypothetical protein